MLSLRSGFPEQERSQASLLIQRALGDMPAYRAARMLALYAPIRGEVDTGWLMQLSWSLGKTVLMPAMSETGLVFREANSPDALAPGAFGILEPRSTPEHLPEEADLLVVPGVAFDLAGRRLGYGKGCYDRVLHTLEGAGRLTAFAYDFQVVDEIAGEPHDVWMDLIITEKRILRPLCNYREGSTAQ